MAASSVVVGWDVVVESVVVVAVVGFASLVGIASEEVVVAFELAPCFVHGILGGPVEESTFAALETLVLDQYQGIVTGNFHVYRKLSARTSTRHGNSSQQLVQ